MLARLFAWIRGLFGGSPSAVTDGDDSRPTPESPIVTSSNPEGTTVEISLYQTDNLTRRNGRAPEQTVARYLAEALTRVGYNVEIRFDHETVAADEYRTASGTALAQWASHPYGSVDASLLIHENPGNGIAYVGGRAAIGPGGHIDRLLAVEEAGQSASHRNVRACLHEIGHTLGGRHADGMQQPPDMWYQNVEAGWMDSPPP